MAAKKCRQAAEQNTATTKPSQHVIKESIKFMLFNIITLYRSAYTFFQIICSFFPLLLSTYVKVV